jgi:hypothetical protein
LLRLSDDEMKYISTSQFHLAAPFCDPDNNVGPRRGHLVDVTGAGSGFFLGGIKLGG